MLNLGKLLEPLEGRLLAPTCSLRWRKYKGSWFNWLFSDFLNVQSVVKAFKGN
jgi:hypothetical protein